MLQTNIREGSRNIFDRFAPKSDVSKLTEEIFLQKLMTYIFKDGMLPLPMGNARMFLYLEIMNDCFDMCRFGLHILFH